MSDKPGPPPNPFVDERVSQALEPYRDVLPPDALDELGAIYRDVLASFPAAAQLMRQLCPNPAGNFKTEDRECGSLEAGVVQPARAPDEPPPAAAGIVRQLFPTRK